jgi:hypothetical protein
MAVKTKKDMERVDVEKFGAAHHHLLYNYISPVRAMYSVGKTDFRDFLYEKMGCSLDEAERLVDALEATKKIEFRRARKGARYRVWIIHCNPEEEVAAASVA